MEKHIRIFEFICLARVIMQLSPPKIKTVGYKPNRQTTSRPGTYNRLKLLYLIYCVFMVISETKAQQVAGYAIQANVIYHFTKYINWPDDKKNGDFIIGIVGDTPLYDELKVFMASKTVGGRKVVIKKASSDNYFNCHILFISEDESGRLKKIIATIKNAPTLLVSESEGLAEKGSCINFVLINDRLNLEINKSSIEQRGLNIANELLRLGKIVK